jgi:ribA/ribD-fused uncharacterized protein
MIDSFDKEYAFLSNFYPCVVECSQGIIYPTVEHAFQASKTMDMDDRLIIADTATPGQAKRMGRKVQLVDNWNLVRIRVMERLLRQKFKQERFSSSLKLTKGHELIEGNHWNDTFWGVCRGKGKNNLGKLLMAIRDDLLFPDRTVH